MPTASDEQRNWACKHFGSISDAPIIADLERRGFTLTKDWCWKRGYKPNEFEYQCINFLINEWDFGGYDED